MHKKRFQRIFAVLLLTLFALCSVPAHTVSAYGLFGKSWINDDSLYWSDGGIGLLPDSFEDASLPSYELARLNSILDSMCTNLMTLKTLYSLSFFTCGATKASDIIQRYVEFTTNLSKYGSMLSSYIAEYNEDPGDEAYTLLLERITSSNMISYVDDACDYLVSEAASTIAAKYDISVADYKTKPWSWTYKFLYDELEEGFELAYQDGADFTGEWKTFLARNPYIGPVPVTAENVTAPISWADNVDIYYRDFQSAIETIHSYEIYGLADVTETKRGIEKSLSNLVIRTATKMYNMLTKNGVDIKAIIFGRVKAGGGTPVAVNSFQFELRFKNVYGVIGAVVYAALKAFMVFGIIIAAMFLGAKAAFTHSAKAKEAIKSNIAYAFIAVVLLYAMPNLIDILVYIKDILLSVLGTTLNGFSEKEQITELTKWYYDNATSTYGSFFDALLYLGFIILSAYFSVVYIAAACSLTIVFGFFPLFLLLSFKDKKLLGTWVNFMVGTLITPVIDCVLLHMPVIAKELHCPRLLLLFMCFAIIPSRGVIRKLLGFGGSIGSELLGVGALMMAGRAAGGLVRHARMGINKVATNGKQWSADRKNAKMEEELAKVENEGVNSSYRSGALIGASAEASASSASSSSTANTYRSGSRPEPLEKLNYKTDEEYQVALARAKTADAKRGDGNEFETNLVSQRRDADRDTQIRNIEIAERNAAVAHQEEQVRATYAKYANKDNFENSEIFNSLSHEQKAKLYRQKALYNASEAVGSGLGMVAGGVSGGVIGLGAGTMLGPSAMVMMGSMGAAAGGGIGEFAGITAGRGVGTLVGKRLPRTRTVSSSTSPTPINPGGGSDSGEGGDTTDVSISALQNQNNVVVNDNIVSDNIDRNILINPDAFIDATFESRNIGELMNNINASLPDLKDRQYFGLKKSWGRRLGDACNSHDDDTLNELVEYMGYEKGSQERRDFIAKKLPDFAMRYYDPSNKDPELQESVNRLFGGLVDSPNVDQEALNQTLDDLGRIYEGAYKKFCVPNA